MALLFPKKPAIFNRGQLRVANIYSRPALAPYYSGVRGFGQARRTSTQSFEETLRSFATTPFAVNSESYMDMIRERYGFSDKQLQNTLGVIGGVVGAGTTAAIQGGLFLGTRGVPLSTSRRQAQSLVGFRRYTPLQIKNITEYNTQAVKVAESVKNLNTASDAKKAAEEILNKSIDDWNKVKFRPDKNAAKKAAKLAKDVAQKNVDNVIKNLDSVQSVSNATRLAGKEAAEKLSKVGITVADKAVEAGTSIGRKAAGIAPYLGMAADVASLGISTAGLVQDIKAGDIGNAVLSGVETLGDLTAVVGNVLEYTPLQVLGIGTAVSAIGALVSTGVSAMRVGFSIGESIGRSLTPSGLQAQTLFAQNVGANIAARPVSTLAALTAQIAIPYIIGRVGAKYQPKFIDGLLNKRSSLGNRLLYGIPSFLGNNVIGNQVRAGLTMFISQSLAPVFRKVDELLPTYDPEGSDFVAAISLYGDLQDNLYGATRTKSILLGLADNDPNAKRDALARAWGYSEKPAYVLTAADIVEKTDVLKDAPSIVKSVLGVVGEIVLDPRNFDEMVQGKVKQKRTEVVSRFIEKELQRVEIGKLSENKIVSVPGNVGMLVDSKQRGIFRDTHTPKTRGLIIGAVNAYFQGGKKALIKYLTEQSIQTYKGIKVGDINAQITKQVDVVKTLIDSVIDGTYVSPLTINGVTGRSLIQQAKKQHATLVEYETTGKMPAGIKKQEIDKMQKFIGLIGSRYGSYDMDIVGKKMINDLKVKPDVNQIQKYYDASDAFSNYMDLTDKLNASLIFVLNPIGRLIQMGEGRFLRWFNETTRKDMNTIQNRMVTLETIKEVKKNLQNVPTYDALKKLVGDETDEETIIRNIIAPNRKLTRSEELLIEDIKENLKNDKELQSIKNNFDAQQEYFTRLTDQVKKQLQALEDNRSKYAFRTIDYKINNSTITIDDSNYSEKYKRLQDLRALPNPTKDESQERTALSAAFVDYEMAINNVEIYQKYVEHYQAVLNVLNLASIRADDYTLNVLQSLFAFKAYFNTLVPQKATDNLKNEFNRLDARLTKVKKDLEDEEDILNNKKNGLLLKKQEFEKQYKADFLKTDVDYQALIKRVNDTQTRIAALKTSEDEVNKKIDVNKKELADLQKLIRNGKKDPVSLIKGFDPVKFELTVKTLNELQRVNLLNGIQFQITIKDKDGNETKENINEKITQAYFIKVYETGNEIKEVGVVLKDNFELQINKLLNTLLGKNVFEDLLNYNHKHFNLDLKTFKDLTPQNKVKTIVAYINESNLKQEDKDKLLEDKTLRKAIITMESIARTKVGSTTFYASSQISSDLLYRYVMQEQMKLYKDGADPKENKNPIIQAFVKAAEIIKNLDDQVAKTTGKIDEFTQATLEELQGRFETSLRYTPIYRYVKSFLYNYLQHDKNKLTLFKRSTISEILPDNIEDYDIQKAVKNERIANNIINNFLESDFTRTLLNPLDLKSLREASIVRFKMNVNAVLTEEESKLKDKVIQRFNKAEDERIIHELEEKEVKSVTDEAAKDDARLSPEEKRNKILEKIMQDKYGPTEVRTQLSLDIVSLPATKGKGTGRFARSLLVKGLVNNRNYIILPEYLQIRLNMSLFLRGKKDVNIYEYLKENNRSTVEYEEAVGAFSYKLAWLFIKYPEIIKFKDIDTSGNVEDIAKRITAAYLKDGNVDVQIKMEDKFKKQVQYTKLFKALLFKQVGSYLGKGASTADIKDWLLDAATDQNKDDVLKNLISKTNSQIHGILNRNKKSIIMFSTLTDAIVDLRDLELGLKTSIDKYTAEASPSIRIQAILKSKEIQELFKDLATAKADKNPNEYSHIFFKILHVVKDYYTEDYATKIILKSFDSFDSLELKDNEIYFNYKLNNKVVQYSVFDMIFIHGLSRTDFNRFVETVGLRTAASKTSNQVKDLIAAALTSYDMLIEEYGSLLTNNAFSISKEVFMKQEGATEELYKLFTDPGVTELRQRLRLVNNIFEQDLNTNQIDFNMYYDNRYRSYSLYIDNALVKYNDDLTSGKPVNPKFVFYAYDKDDNKKEMFTISLTNKNGSLRNKNTLLLLTLLQLTQLNADEFKGYSIKRPDDGIRQQVFIKPEAIKTIIKDIFFKDSKAVKGKAQNTNIVRLEKFVKDLNEDLKEYQSREGIDKGSVIYKRTVNMYKIRKQNYNDLIKFYKEINSKITIDPFNKFDVILEDMIKDPEVAERYFNNVVNTDGDDFALGYNKAGEPKLYRTKDIPDYKDRNDGKGIPTLNVLLIKALKNNDSNLLSLMQDRVAKNEQVKNVDVRIVTDDGSAVVVVPDKNWSFDNTKSISTVLKRVMNNNYETGERDVIEVYVLSESKYAEIQELGKLKQSDVPTIDIHKINDDNIVPIPDIINVQGNKVIVDYWLDDINLVFKESLDTSNKTSAFEVLKKLSEFYALRYSKKNLQGFVPILKAYGNGVNLFNTQPFQKLVESAKLNTIFFEFYNLIGEEDYDIHTIGVNFFNSKFINADYNLNNIETDLNAQLVQRLKSRGLFNKIVNALQYLQNEYGRSPLLNKLNYFNILTPDSISELLKLKNSIYGIVKYIERTNNTAYQKIVPIIEKHIQTSLSDEVSSSNIKTFNVLYNEVNHVFYSVLDTAFKDPYKKEYDPVKLFDGVKNNIYAGLQGLSILNAQQYYLKTLHDLVSAAKRRHYVLHKKYKNNSINYLNFTSIRTLFRDFNNRNITSETLYKKLKELFVIPEKVKESIYAVATKIYEQEKNKKDGYTSAERIADHLIYGYIIKSYLVSIKQFMDRNITNELDGYNNVDYLNLLTHNESLLRIKEKDNSITAQETILLKEIRARLKASNIIKDNAVRYTYNNEHLIYKGNDTSKMFSYEAPDAEKVKKQLAENKLDPVENIKIDEYISQYVLKKFGYSLDNADRLSLTDLASDVILTATEYLYSKETKESKRYVSELGTLEKTINKTDTLKKEMIAKGFTEAQIRVMFDVGNANISTGRIITDTSEYKKMLTDSDDLTKETINLFINEVSAIKKGTYKIKKVELSYKEIYEVHTLDLLENSKKFLDYFKDVIRNYSDDTDTEEIVKVMNKFGITRSEVFSILEGEYEDISHFINAHIKNIETAKKDKLSTEDYTKATVLMLFINYHKQQFIENKLNIKDYGLDADKIKQVLYYEKLRDKNNFLNYKTINMNDVLGDGNAITNSINFYFNKGFVTLRKINSRVTFLNDRLQRIILDGTNLKDNDEYTGTRHGIIYKENNIKTVATETQRTLYEPLFREGEAGFVGGRMYELMLMRKDFVLDMMAENSSKTKDVGSSNVLYNSIRNNFTDVLAFIKKDFKPYEFIRVRDVATAVGLFLKEKSAVNYFIEQYNYLVSEAKKEYIVNNSSSKKSPDVLADEFDAELAKRVKQIISISDNNNKIVEFNDSNIKAVIGYIFTARFVDSKDIPEIQNKLAASIKDQLKTDLQYKNYKFKTITSVIYRIIKSDKTNLEKKEELAKLQGKTFDQLSVEQKSIIETGLKINNFINASENFYNPKQWYDTFDVAYGNKNRIGAATTIKMQDEANEELEIDALDKTIIKMQSSLDTSTANARRLDRQNTLFTIKDAPSYYVYDAVRPLNIPQDINDQADLATFILQEKLVEANQKVKEEEKIIKEKKLELINNLFKLYPGLRNFFLDRAENKINLELGKQQLRLDKLKNEYESKIVKEYEAYLKDDLEVKAIEATKEFKIYKLLNEEFEYFIKTNTPANVIFDTLFDFYKDELAVYEVNNVKDLFNIYKDINNKKIIDKLNALRDQRDARGKSLKITSKKFTYVSYKDKRVIIDEKILSLQEQRDNIRLGDVDQIDFALNALTELITDFKKEGKIDLTRTFDTIDRKDNFKELTETAKDLIQARHNKQFNEKMKYLKKAYMLVRAFNISYGRADSKDLGKITEDTLIKPFVLIKAIENETAILKTHLENLKSKKLINITQAITLTELKGENEFKINLYFNTVLELQLVKRELQLGGLLTNQEVKRITEDTERLFENITDPLVAYNLLMSVAQKKESYRPIKSDFGSKNININLSGLTIDQLKHAESLLSIVNNKINNLYNNNIDEIILNNEKLIKQWELTTKDLLLEDDILKRVKKVPTINDSDNNKKLFNSLYAALGGPTLDINNATLESLIRFVANNKSSGQLKQANENKNAIVGQINDIAQVKDELLNVPKVQKNVADLKVLLQEKREALLKIRAEREMLYKKELEVAGDKLSNIDVFKHYYKIKEDEKESDVIDIVLSTLKSRYKNFNVDVIKKQIMSRGDYALHNSIVDSLITFLNYIHQKPNAKNFVVVDLETYKQDGQFKPYQMTMIYEKNDEVIINDVFINSALFFDGLNDDGSYKENMLKFYEQQKSIWKEQWKNENLTEENFEIKAKEKMDLLITRVRNVKNNDNFINTFLQLIGDQSVDIVAHNGYRFDFSLIKDFVSRVGENLIVNEYYRNLREETDVKKIFDNIDKTDLNDDEITKEYLVALQKEYDVTIKQLNERLPLLTSQEADIFKKRLNLINRKTAELKIKQRVKYASEQVGYILNDNIRQQIMDVSTGSIKYINDSLLKHISSKDVIEQNNIKEDLILKFMEGISLDNRNPAIQKIIIEYVEKLIVDVTNTYNQILSGALKIDYGATKTGTTVKTEITLEAINQTGIKLYEEGDALDVNKRLELIDVAILANNNLKEALRLGATSDEILLARQEELDKINKTIEEGQKLIVRLQQEQDTLKVSNEEILLKILDVARKINNNSFGYAKTIGIALNNITANIGSSTGPKSLALFENQQKVAFNNLQNKVQALLNLSTMLSSKDLSEDKLKKTLEKTIDSRLVQVLDGTLKPEDALEQINKELSILNKAEKNIKETGVVALLKIVYEEFIKDHTIILKQTKTELIESLKNLLNIRDYKGVSVKDGEILFNNKVADYKTIKTIYNVITEATDNNQKFFESNTAIVTNVTRLLNTYEESLKYTSIKFDDLLKDNFSNEFEVFKALVNDRYTALLQTKTFLENYKGDRTLEEKSTDAVLLVYKDVLHTLTGIQDNLERIKNESILTLITGEIPSDRMTDEQYEDVASRILPQEEIDQDKLLKKEGVKVMYDDPTKGNDIKVLRTVSNTVLSKVIKDASDETNNTYIFTVLDQEYNEANNVVYNAKSNTLTINLKYGYIPAHLKYSGGTSKGFQIQEKKIEVALNPKNKKGYQFTVNELKEFINENKHFYWQDTKSDKKLVIIPNLKQDELHFSEGKDSSKDAIKVLIEWIIKSEDKFVNFKKDDTKAQVDDKLKIIKELYDSTLTHEKFAGNYNYLQVINISKIIKNQFFAELSLYQSNQKLTAINIKEIYSGIYNRITAKYKALEPGSLINQINSDYSYDYNLDSFDAKFLEEEKIDLGLNSDGSMGAVLKYKTKYDFNFPFTLMTNSIRTMLSAKHLLAKYTTVGFLNNIYGDIKEKQAPGKKLLETFLADPIKYLNNKTISDQFIRKTKTSNTQIFMPNIMSESLYNEYKKDSMVHQFGVTVPVAFVKDPRIPLDVIAIDADWARATNWGQGNKTWLGLHYGFKGAVRYIPNLYKTYGAYFAASADSVFSRGTAGAYAEMLFNYIRAYLIKETDNRGNSVVPERTESYFKLIDEHLRKVFLPLITKSGKDNIMLIDGKTTYEIFEELSDVIQSKLGNLPEFTGISKEKLYQVLLLRDYKEKDITDLKGIQVVTPTIVKPAIFNQKDLDTDTDQNKLHERRYIISNLTESKYVRGLLYVYADHENTAQALQTITKVNAVGKLIRTIVDGNNNPIKGQSLSPTVMNQIFTKIGKDNFFKVFKPDYSNLNLLSDVRALGFKTVIKEAINLEKEEDVNSEEAFEKYISLLSKAFQNKKIHEYVRNQGIKYLQLLLLIHTSNNSTIGYQKEVEKLVTNTESNVLQKMYDGKQSAYYKSTFKRWEGIRQQYLADVTLDAGEINLSESAWKAIEERNQRDGGTLIKTEELTNKQKIKEYIETALTYKTDEEREEYLNSRGIFAKENEALYKELKANVTDVNKLSALIIKQTYTYLLAARSPVQDYAAVPVFKAIGYSKSYAANINVYAYNMMGADNDGDALGMALLKINDVEGPDAPLKNLLSTDLNYYTYDEEVKKDSKGNVINLVSYLEKSNEEMFGKEELDLIKNEHKVGNVDLISYKFTRNQTGKNTFNKDVRPNKEYLEIEEYVLIEPDILAQLGETVRNTIIELDTSNTANLKVYVNAHIRMTNQGNDFAGVIKTINDYQDNKKVLEYYNTNKENIDLLYTLEAALTQNKVMFGNDVKLNKDLTDVYLKYFTEEEQNIITNDKDPEFARLYKRFVRFVLTKKIEQFTTSRGRASKNGVNYTGNKRKDQFISSFLSIYPRINLSKTGEFWKSIGAAANQEGEVTIASLLKAIIGKDVTDLSPDEILNLLTTIKQTGKTGNSAINNPKGSMRFFVKDVPLIINDLIRLVEEYKQGFVELENLSDLVNQDTVTYREYITFLQSSSKTNDPVIANYIKQLSKYNPEEIISNSFVKELLMFYFNNPKTLNGFLNGRESIEELMSGYLNQFVIERVALNNMSRLIQKDISMNKHDGIDTNPNQRSLLNRQAVDEITTKKSIRKIILGSNNIESLFGMAINTDRNMRERIDLKLDKIGSGSINQEYFEQNPDSHVSLKENYTEEKPALNDINALIVERAKLFLLGNLFMPDTFVTTMFNKVIQLNNALINPVNYMQYSNDLINSIRFFESMNIPFYKLSTFLRDVLSIANVVSERFVSKYKLDINKVNLVKNTRNILSLMYRLRDPNFMEVFKNRYGKETVIYNFFQNVNDMTEGWFIVDEEGNRTVFTPEDDLLDEDIKEAISEHNDVHLSVSVAGSNNGPIISKTSDELLEATMPEVSKDITDRLKYSTFNSEIEKIDDVINNFRTEIDLILTSTDNIEEQIKNTKKIIKKLNLKTTAQNELSTRRVRNAIRDTANAKQYAKLEELQNKKSNNDQLIKETENKIKLQEKEQSKLKTAVKNVERIKAWYAENKNPIAKLEEENKQLEKDKEEIKTIALQNAVLNNIGGGILLLRTVDGYGMGDSSVGKPRYLTQEDLNKNRERSTLEMTNNVTLLTNMIDPNNLDLSFKIIYNFMKERQGDFRLVIVKPPYEDEGAYRSIVDQIRKFDPNKDTKTKLFTKFTEEEFKSLKFNNMEELKKWQTDGGKVVFNGQVYEKIDPKIILENNKALTPTYKEIPIRSLSELKEIYEVARGNNDQGVRPIIGFIDLDTWMQTMDNTYKSTKVPNGLEKFAWRLQLFSKNVSKFSAAFLFRNLNDTVYQLFSNAQILPKVVDSKDFTHMTMTSLELYNLYEKYSDEHTATIVSAGLYYEDILNQLKMPVPDSKVIEKNINLMKEILESYYIIGRTIDNPRIKFNLNKVERLIRIIKQINFKNVDKYKEALYDVVTLISNIKFGEYIELYDNREINGKMIAGLRIDSRDENNNVRTNAPSLSKLISGEDNKWKKDILKQLSAFMYTSATSDYLRKDNFELLPEVFERYRGYDDNDTSTNTYEEIKKMITDARKIRRDRKGFFPFKTLSSALINLYDDINTKIENSARITNFLYNLMIYNKTFDESVTASLRSWFNYGLRSPLEQRLLADIPFVSFPVRSIQNWIDRLNNPRWWRFMSDFFDGWYGQYIDEEEKEYDDFMKYQMRNGWIPLSKNFGLRIGNGALDVMNILYNTQEAFEGRISPILRAVKTLVEKRNVFESLNQLASLGLIGRIANTVTGASDLAAGTKLREQAARTPILREMLDTRQATLGRTLRGFAYDIVNYEKYTPRRYRYGRNGRYAKYENIYKDWFNKYGRMRRPTTNPYRLVKNIQWRQYVRYRQSQAALLK